MTWENSNPPSLKDKNFLFFVLVIKNNLFFAAAYGHIYIEFPQERGQKGLRKALFFVLSKIMLLSFELLPRPGYH
tara:strand:+ start:1357 stop:1581 length:225 start_codon:yes stop_codon:yes gene_type:complete